MEWNKLKGRMFINIKIRLDVFPLGSRIKEQEGGLISSFFFSEIPYRIKAGDIFVLFGCTKDVIN